MRPDRPRAEREPDRRLLGDLLIEAGLVSKSGLKAGLEEQQLRGGRLGFNLMKVGSVVPAAFHLFLQDHVESLTPELALALRVAPAIDLIPARLAHHYGMVPARVEDGVLDLAVANADIARLLPAIEELTGMRVDPVIWPPALIASVLSRFYPSEVEAGIVHLPGESRLVLSDRRRDLRPLLPEMVREDAPAGDWLRAILAEGIRRGARRIRIDPDGSSVRVAFSGAASEAAPIDMSPGAYPGVLSLLTGLTGIVAKGRVAPREGRMTVVAASRRIRVSLLVMPGLSGDSCRLDLRGERVAAAGDDDLAADLPDLGPVLREWTSERRGLLYLATPGPAETVAGITAIVHLLGERLPLRLACGDLEPVAGLATLGQGFEDEESLPMEALLDRALERHPDLIVLPEAAAPRSSLLAAGVAASRAVLAVMTAVDAFDAAERVARRDGRGAWEAAPLLGFVGARLMERLCRACAHPFDVQDLLSPWPAHRRPLPGRYLASRGCDACRGSGVIRLQPVFEFLPGAWLQMAGREPARAAELRSRAAREGRTTLFQAGLRRSAAGVVDVREPLRLLLHELG